MLVFTSKIFQISSLFELLSNKFLEAEIEEYIIFPSTLSQYPNSL